MNQNVQKDNTSDLINKYSRTLDTSAEALRAAAKSFDSSTTKLNSDYKRTTDYLVQMMVKTAKAFDKDVSDLETSMKERSQDSSNETNQLAKQNKNLVKSLDDTYKGHLTGLQRYGGAFIKSVELVGSALLNRYKTAASNVLSSYENNLSAITVRMFDSNSEYTTAMQKATDQIRSMDLTKQFSQIDFTEQLATVLETGIRKSSSSQLDITSTVMGNLITNKLTPYISTNTRTYTRMTKLLGENFTQGMTGLATVLEDKYGAEGLEQGQFDATLEAFGNMMQANAKQSGESASKAISAAVEMNDRIANTMGSEESDHWRSLITEIAETGKSSDAVMLAAMQKAGVYNAADVSNAEKLQELTSTYYDMVRGSTSAAWGGQYSQAYGTSAQTIWAAQGAGSLKSLTDPLTKTYKSLNTYFQKQESLTEGYGQSKTAQYEKGYENSVAKGVDTLADKIPHALDNLELIYKAVSAWFAAWLGKGLVKSVGGKVFGKGSLGTEGGLSLGKTSLLNNSTSFAEQVALLKGGAGSLSEVAELGKSGLTGLGKASGVLSIIAGLVMAGVDAKDAVSRAKQSGTSAIGAGAEGFFTGSSIAGMSEEEKQQYYQQSGYFNISDVFKNAGKYALVGGGVGTFAGGPLGTAIGTAVGGVTGAVTSAIDQAVNSYDYRKLDKATEEASKSLANLKQASSDYESTLKKTDKTQSNLNIIQENLGKSTDDTEEAFAALKAEYPEYLTGLTSSKDMNQDLVDVLKRRIEAEKLSTLKDTQEAAEKASSAESKKLKKEIKVASKDTISDAERSFANFVKKEGKNGVVTKDQIVDWTNQNDTPSLYELNKLGAIRQTGSGYTISKRLSKSKDKSSITEALNPVIAQKFSSDSTLMQLYNNIVESYNSLYDDKGHLREDLSQGDKSSYQSLLESSSTSFKNLYNETKSQFKKKSIQSARNFKSEAKASFGDDKLKEMLDKGNVKFSYKLGTDKTKEGRAYLHENEAVLTADTASKMRTMASGLGGISNLVDLMYSVNRGLTTTTATASAADSSSLESPIYTLLTTYTKSVTDSLSSLVSMVSQLVNTDDVDFPKSLRNSKLASYKGV